MDRTIEKLKENYNIELERILKEIEKIKAKRVLLQFPDGMKPYAQGVVDELNKKVDCEFIIWLGSCFGACDTPRVDEKDFDLLIQFGHSIWK